MPRTRLLLSSSLLLALVLGCGSAARAAAPATAPSASDAAATPHRWDRTEQGFTLQTSGDWVSRTTTQPHVVLTLRRDVATGAQTRPRLLIITVVPLRDPANPTPLDAQVEGVRSVVEKTHPEAKFEPAVDMSLDRVEAKMLAFKYTLNKQPSQAYRVVAENAGNLYLVAYSCEEASAADGRQELDSILLTFRWTKK